MHDMIIELAPFAAAPGISDSEIAAASARLETDFLARADGYLGRLLLAEGEGRYLDIVLWRSQADADRATAAAAENPACHAYFACMAEADHADPGAGVRHYRLAGAFGAAAALTREAVAA